MCCVVCFKSWAVGSYKIGLFIADFDGGFVFNHEHAVAKRFVRWTKLESNLLSY